MLPFLKRFYSILSVRYKFYILKLIVMQYFTIFIHSFLLYYNFLKFLADLILFLHI